LSGNCKNIKLDSNNNCQNTDKTVYDTCKLYERKRNGEYPEINDLFLDGGKWEEGNNSFQVYQKYRIEEKYYYLIADKLNIPHREYSSGHGEYKNFFNIYDDGYFRIIKKLEKVIFVRWVCGR